MEGQRVDRIHYVAFRCDLSMTFEGIFPPLDLWGFFEEFD
jgi:hypothetical protein